MDVFVILNRAQSLGTLAEDVHRLEDLGVDGVLMTDHLFMSPGGRRDEASRPSEPLTVLAAVAALSPRMKLGTLVSNIGLLHPALVLRQFAQLAAFVGGERVLAGLGAGWNREEFEALGMAMPRHAQRLDRLEQAAALARQLFDRGAASLEGSQVVARDLPLSPLPDRAPRLLLGGGSERLLEIAGRYADVLDLNGSPSSTPVVGKDLPAADIRRELSTAVDHLEASIRRVEASARAAGRAETAVQFSIMLNYVEICSSTEAEAAEVRLTSAAGLPPMPLDRCPHALLGETEHLVDLLRERRDRLQLHAVMVGGSVRRDHLERLCRDVFPRVRSA